MKYKQAFVFKITSLCLILLFLGLMSASVTHAETYTFVAKWGSSGSGDGQFNWPVGVAVDSSSNVYVADSKNHRIQKFAVLVANFTSNVTEGYSPLTVQFTDFSENATSLNWNFGDGNNSTEQNPVHTYSTAGNYAVNLTASNANGTDSTSATINVSEKPVILVANFISNVTIGSVPLTVQFTDASTSATAWNWDFGDGATSTEQNPVHAYKKLGKYTVKLTVNNAQGSNTISKSNYITVVSILNPLHAAFSAKPASGTAPLKVTFTDKSTRNPASWNWTFGDGMYSTEQNPIRTYSKAGQYMVKLTVKNAAGSSTKTLSNYIIVKK